MPRRRALSVLTLLILLLLAGDLLPISSYSDHIVFAAGEDPNIESLSWHRLVLEISPLNSSECFYFQAFSGDPTTMAAAVSAGCPYAQSALAFLHSSGSIRESSPAKAFIYHHFAANGGSLESKMALAYVYFRQARYEEAAGYYEELAMAAIESFPLWREPPLTDFVRIHNRGEENTLELRRSLGEMGDEIQIMEYQARSGNSLAMSRMGWVYYYGLRGLRRDHDKALYWISKAVEKREPRAIELLAEMYASGAGVERNYAKAFELLSMLEENYSAFVGLGYLYFNGYGVEKNFTMAKEYFEKAAKNEEPRGHYNLGLLYLKGVGVERDFLAALKHFIPAANAGDQKAAYQLANMYHKGIGVRKNLQMAATWYKDVAEMGPWNSLLKWALESYLKGDVGKALILYSRMAELGYEVAQSNAAWILDKYGKHSMCIGESGFCTDTERDLRKHAFWLHASDQGNDHAALAIGDAYYYGRGTATDYEHAAKAYLRAVSLSNAQAMFNLGYMHEHGQGLPLSLHLAKRFYHKALETDPAAKYAVALALTSLWIRKNFAHSFLVHMIDALPKLHLRIKTLENVLMDEDNATIILLFVSLLAIIFHLHHQRRRRVIVPPSQH
ncbi:putative ERAD-associated E3 ubiquitin-protein ligase component HRD3 [Dioscorea sansibarensis]